MATLSPGRLFGLPGHPRFPHLGDPHNFGRRVTLGETRIVKPRTLLWEWLLLAAESPLRRLLDALAERDPLVLWSRLTPFWDTVRNHPRYEDVVRPLWS